MLVSIIIPSFNRKEFLREAIASILSQSIKDFELVIIEDGTDRDRRSSLKDSRVKIFYRRHQGVAAARNFGVSVSSGRYVAFLDSDDLWVKDKLNKQLDYMRRHPEFKISYTEEKWLRRGQHLNQWKKHQKCGGWIFDKCLPLCLLSCSSVMMERELFEAVGGFDERLPVCEDYDLWLRIAYRYPIGFINEPLIIKRGGHPDQLSKKYWGMDRFRVRSLENLLRLGLSTEQRALVLAELEKKCRVVLSGAWKRKKYLRWLYYQYKRLCHRRKS